MKAIFITFQILGHILALGFFVYMMDIITKKIIQNEENSNNINNRND